jgi:single-stranded-DNA-specific exonuclease
MSPFGMGNPEPVFMIRGASIVDRRILKERHLKLRLAVGEKIVEAVGFDMAESNILSGTIDAVFSLGVNIWNGRRNLQLRLKDFRAAV